MILKEFVEIESSLEESLPKAARDYENAEINEEQAEEILEKYAYMIEDGLSYLDHQVKSDGSKRIEALFADSLGTLVAAVMKLDGTEDMLSQSLSYYNDIVRNIEVYSRIFNEKFSSLDIDPTRRPRIFLIMSAADTELIEKCRWFDIDISAFAFRCVHHIDSGGIIPAFINIPMPDIPKTLTADEMSETESIREEVEESQETSDASENEGKSDGYIYIDARQDEKKEGDYENLKRESVTEEEDMDNTEFQEEKEVL